MQQVTGAIKSKVRTFTGAWIETFLAMIYIPLLDVRTFTGAWIETNSHSPLPLPQQFAPSQVRGLKQAIRYWWRCKLLFAPSQVRGLKQLHY